MLKKKSSYQILFAAFLPFFVLVEIYRGLVGPKISIGRFALEEVLVILYAAILFLSGCVFAWKENRKKIVFFALGYAILFLVYTLIHSWHIMHFNTAVFSAAQPDFFVECYYLFRVFAMPAAVLFAAAMLRVPLKWFLRGAEIAVFLTSICIIISSLFGFSYICYANGRHVVEGGFLEGLTVRDPAKIARYTAKGPFLIGNVMGAFLFGLTPFCAWDFWKRKKWTVFAVLFCDGLASVMMGTKVPTIGFFIAVFAVSILYLIRERREKKLRPQWKAIAALLALFAVLLPLYFLSPGFRYQKVRLDALEEDLIRDDLLEKAIHKTKTDPAPAQDGLSEEDRRLSKYLYAHYTDHFINGDHLEIYPFAEDPEFWREVIERDPALNHSYRTFKLEMASRIRERNDSPLDYVLGMGYTSNIPYAERDFADQFNLFGAVGIVILLLPVGAAFLWGVKDFLPAFFTKKEYLFTGVFLIGVGSLVSTGVSAGHVLSGTGIINTYLLYLLSGMILSRMICGGENAE